MNAALALLTDTATTADLERIQAALTAWLVDEEGPSLQQYLGINRAAARRELRNQRLRRAAAYLDATGKTDLAEQLAESARAFTVRRWPRWRISGPPPEATRLDLELFAARQFGPIDLGARQLLNIL